MVRSFEKIMKAILLFSFYSFVLVSAMDDVVDKKDSYSLRSFLRKLHSPAELNDCIKENKIFYAKNGEDGSCYLAGTQGPCPENHWLILKAKPSVSLWEKQVESVCELQPCILISERVSFGSDFETQETTEAFGETSTAFPTEQPEPETTATTEQATTAFTTSFLTKTSDDENTTDNSNNNNNNNNEVVEKCKNLSEELIPLCGEGQEIKYDPFGRPFCVCKPYHFRLLKDDINDNNNSTTVDNEIEDNAEDNHNDDVEVTDNRIVFENVGQHPFNCYIAGSHGPCPVGQALNSTLNSRHQQRLECVVESSDIQVLKGIEVPSNLCGRGFVFKDSVEDCVEVGASFGESENLERYLDDFFFGK